VVLEKAAGCTIPELFQRDGEQGFRALERQVLQQIASWHSLVVATGGGVVSQPANWGEMHQGVVVWLNVAAAELRRRLHADPGQRPLLTGPEGDQRLGELLEQRLPLYAQADLEVDAGSASPPQLAEQIIKALPSRLKVRSAPPATAP
jgi:shikimate kinase